MIFVRLVGRLGHVGEGSLALGVLGRFWFRSRELYVGQFCLRLERVLCWSFSLSLISPCAGRHFISLSNGDKETEAKKTPTDASI